MLEREHLGMTLLGPSLIIGPLFLLQPASCSPKENSLLYFEVRRFATAIQHRQSRWFKTRSAFSFSSLALNLDECPVLPSDRPHQWQQPNPLHKGHFGRMVTAS